ncbi:MAG: hypothetical protein ABL951_01255 [Alphaproteobacteria bacterium]
MRDCDAMTPGMESTPAQAEIITVITILGLLLVLRIMVCEYLDRLGVLAQNNILFDSDTYVYLSAISNGWSINRVVHPAFATMINIPVRVFDFVAAYLGISAAGSIRTLAPIILSPIAASLGGFIWWLAALSAGFSAPARIAGLLFSQFVFSLSVFSALPESYAISGALLSLLLLFTVRAVQHPETLGLWKIRAQWLALACVMTGVTITNGFICVAVWMAIRFGPQKLGWIQLRRILTEGIVAAAILGATIVVMITADQLAYPKDNKSLVEKGGEATGWVQRFMEGSAAERAVAMPVSFIAGIFPPAIEIIPNNVAKPGQRYQIGFSFEAGEKTLPRIMFGWFSMAALAAVLAWRFSFSPIIRAIAAVLAFNGVLHSFYGAETFLYSQHWSAFLTFAIILPMSGKAARGANVLLASLVTATCLFSLNAWIHMMDVLNGIFVASAQAQ